MFPYRVKYADSESDIQNNDLLYKINQKCQNTLKNQKMLQTSKMFKKFKFLFCNMYKLHNSYFVLLKTLQNLYFW